MIDGVTLNQLRAFVAICDQGSFSGAARQLKRAQSAVSHAVAALEGSLRVDLFERDARRTTLSAAGRSLLPDARAVISRTEELKNRARSIAKAGVLEFSVAVDVYFDRSRLIRSLQSLQANVPTAAINLRMTTMQGGERLVLGEACSLAITIADVPEVDPSAIERHWLSETPMLTVCAPSHPLAADPEPISLEEFARHVQLVVTDNQPSADRTQVAVAGKRQWLLDDLSAKHDFLKAGLCWGHMPAHLVAGDIAAGTLVELKRRAWHVRPLTFMVSRRRGHDLSAEERSFVELLAD